MENVAQYSTQPITEFPRDDEDKNLHDQTSDAILKSAIVIRACQVVKPIIGTRATASTCSWGKEIYLLHIFLRQLVTYDRAELLETDDYTIQPRCRQSQKLSKFRA